MLGFLDFKLGGKVRRVYGGPYHQKPSEHFGVKMAEEINLPCHVSVPTRDFSVPDLEELNAGIRATLKAMSKGHLVYVGCMGGKGRTGLFLAALAKVLGHPHPVAYVRKTYYSHAVETAEQKSYVEGLDVAGFKWAVRFAHVRSFFYR